MLEKLMFKMYVRLVTLKNKGISINKKYEIPVRGYMVGIKNFKTLNEMLKVELQENEFYGTWLDVKTGITYYDISKNIIDYKEAVDLATSRKELAIFDVEQQSSIYF